MAEEAIKRIAGLYAVEKEGRGGGEILARPAGGVGDPPRWYFPIRMFGMTRSR